MNIALLIQFVLMNLKIVCKGKFVLVELNWKNDIVDHGIKKYHRYFWPTTAYPKRELLKPTYKTTCENKDIKNKRPPTFYIKRTPGVSNHIRWIAVLEPSSEQELAHLTAERGHCNDLHTEKGSRKCGIGKALMALCFKDEDIIEDGGLNPLTDGTWKDEKLKTIARDVCKTIIHISCEPDIGIDLIACKMYMDAANEAGYHMIFVQNLGDDKLKRLQIEDAKNIFEQNVDDFLSEKGSFWYFCKCKANMLQKCLGLADE